MGGERDPGVDLARVVGLVAMVVGHVWNAGLPVQLTYTWHMPLFFVLSGWFWHAGRPLRAEWSARARTLLVPYAAWLVVVAAFFFAYERPNVRYWVKELLIGGSLPRPFSAFWFVTALAAVCLLRRALEAAGLDRPAVTGLAVGGWLVSYGLGVWLHDWPESIGTAAYTLIFLVAGEWLRDRHLPLPVALTLVTGGLALSATGVVQHLNLKGGHLGTPVAGYAVAAAVAWGVIVLCGRVPLPPAAQSAVTALARTALPLVLLHAAVILVLGDQRWLTFGVALVVPWGLGLLLMRTRLAPLFVTGLPRGVI